MTVDASRDDYQAFLERQDVATLRDWALQVARERKDVGQFRFDQDASGPDGHP